MTDEEAEAFLDGNYYLRFLIDTAIFYWALFAPERISTKVSRQFPVQ